MRDEARKELKLAAISLGCAVLLLAILMVGIAVAGSAFHPSDVPDDGASDVESRGALDAFEPG